MANGFIFEINIATVLDIKEIWPDGDAPENPTVADVRARFLKDGRGNIIAAAQEWNLDQGADLIITKE